MAALELLETLLANDAANQVRQMVGEGWSLPAALDAVRGCYRTWVLAHLGDAIDFGAGWAEVAA